MQTAVGLDAVMCALINGIQWGLRNHVCTPEELDIYLSACEPLSRDLFYKVQDTPDLARVGSYLEWRSPVQTLFPENQTARARIFLTAQGYRAPTVIFLHALMSAHDLGYCRIASHLNRRGWNAVLMHLPYHYSRVPRGYFNGALALTSNLPHNAETLRQAVTEVRQLMEFLRANGCPDFGMIGTSYGGWVGALVSFLGKGVPICDAFAADRGRRARYLGKPCGVDDSENVADCQDPPGCLQAARAFNLSPGWSASLRGETCSGYWRVIRHDCATFCPEKVGEGLARVTIRPSRTRSLRLCRDAGGDSPDRGCPVTGQSVESVKSVVSNSRIRFQMGSWRRMDEQGENGCDDQ